MDDSKITQLKAHQQFILGRIESIRWVEQNLDIDDEKAKLREYAQKLQHIDLETSAKINRILRQREVAKEERKAKKEAAKLKHPYDNY